MQICVQPELCSMHSSVSNKRENVSLSIKLGYSVVTIASVSVWIKSPASITRAVVRTISIVTMLITTTITNSTLIDVYIRMHQYFLQQYINYQSIHGCLHSADTRCCRNNCRTRLSCGSSDRTHHWQYHTH